MTGDRTRLACRFGRPARTLRGIAATTSANANRVNRTRPERWEWCESAHYPSPALQGTLSASEGERDRVRGRTSLLRFIPGQACGSGVLSLVAAFLCTTGLAGARPINLNGAVLVAETNQPSYTQHAIRELQSYLGEITSTPATVSPSLRPGAQPAIFIGGVSARQRLPDSTLAALGEEGYVIRSSALDGRDCLLVSGATAKGTKFGIYALMKLIRPHGRAALVELPLAVSSRPAVTLRGMHLNGWPIKYPYSFRPWPEADWHRYIDLLSCQGVNLLYIWPFMEIIPAPVSAADAAYLEEFRRVVDYAQREHGMEVWMMQSPNRVAKSNCGVADPRDRPYWRPEHQVDLNPGDPEQLQQILDSRKALYRVVNNVDGVCTIDCDPGGWPGAPLS